MTIPCPATGVVARLCGSPGEVLEVGAVLAVIESDGGPRGGGDGPQAPSARAAGGRPPSAAAFPWRRRPAAARPRARRGARGTSRAPGRRAGVRDEDVERAAGRAERSGDAALPAEPLGDEAAAPVDDEVIPLRGGAAHDRAHAYARVAGGAAHHRLSRGRRDGARPAPATALAPACARTGRRRARPRPHAHAAARSAPPCSPPREHPYVNASIDLEAERDHAAPAAITSASRRPGPDGLTVPVVRDADRRSLAGLAHEIAALAVAARERPADGSIVRRADVHASTTSAASAWLARRSCARPRCLERRRGAIRDRVGRSTARPSCAPTLVFVGGGRPSGAGRGHARRLRQPARGLLEDPVLLFEDLS